MGDESGRGLDLCDGCTVLQVHQKCVVVLLKQVNFTLAPQLEKTHETPPSSRDEGLLFLHGLESNPESSLQTPQEKIEISPFLELPQYFGLTILTALIRQSFAVWLFLHSHSSACFQAPL